MAAIRPFTIDGVVEFELTGLDLDEVQFTDEILEGELVVRNLSDKRLTGTIEITNETERTLGFEGESLARTALEIDLSPNEEHREPARTNSLITGTGTAVVVEIARPDIEESPEEIVLEPGDEYVPMASLVVWDRDFYRVNYRRPRQAQYVSAAFALLSTLLAGAIVALTL